MCTNRRTCVHTCMHAYTHAQYIRACICKLAFTRIRIRTFGYCMWDAVMESRLTLNIFALKVEEEEFNLKL